MKRSYLNVKVVYPSPAIDALMEVEDGSVTGYFYPDGTELKDEFSSCEVVGEAPEPSWARPLETSKAIVGSIAAQLEALPEERKAESLAAIQDILNNNG